MRCKVNNALLVKKITPNRLLGHIGVFAARNSLQNIEREAFLLVVRQKALDKQPW